MQRRNSFPSAACTRTRNFLTFVKTTVIAYWQKIGQSLKILVARNSQSLLQASENYEWYDTSGEVSYRRIEIEQGLHRSLAELGP